MMFQMQSAGELPDRRTSLLTQAFNRQHQLVLLGLQPVGSRLFFAEPQEAADLISKFRKRTIILQRNIFHSNYPNLILIRLLSSRPILLLTRAHRRDQDRVCCAEAVAA